MSVQIINGDCRELLKTIADGSVDCCVTSPPYFGLRDYGHDKQIGLETNPYAFVSQLVEVFREVRRILKDNGTVWLNLGDSYAGSSNSGGTNSIQGSAKRIGAMNNIKRSYEGPPAKNLIGIPWRVAFGLQADGWYLRQDIIWSKPNPMPESVTDRCTKAHEYIFLLSKSPQYQFDADAIAEDAIYSGLTGQDESGFKDAKNFNEKHSQKTVGRIDAGGQAGGVDMGMSKGRAGDRVDGKRNKRSVWTVATKPFSQAHFATFPPDLIEPCILAGCPKGGTVLDPFGGAGTTGLVADRLGRNAVLIELNPKYAAMAIERINSDAPLFGEVAA